MFKTYRDLMRLCSPFRMQGQKISNQKTVLGRYVLGYNVIGGITAPYIHDDEKHGTWGPLFNLSKTGIFENMVAYCASFNLTTDMRCGIYRRVDGIQNATLEASTEIVEVDTIYAWRIFEFSPHVTISPGNLMFAIQGHGPSAYAFIRYGAPADHYRQCDVPDAFADGLEDPFGPGGALGTHVALSIYANYLA